MKIYDKEILEIPIFSDCYKNQSKDNKDYTINSIQVIPLNVGNMLVFKLRVMVNFLVLILQYYIIQQ